MKIQKFIGYYEDMTPMYSEAFEINTPRDWIFRICVSLFVMYLTFYIGMYVGQREVVRDMGLSWQEYVDGWR